MNPPSFKPLVGRLAAAVVLIALGAAGAMLWTQTRQPPAAAQDAPASPADQRRVLYWYDPMVPSQRFDKPGKSPFMDMELVPKYADEGGDAASVKIDPSIAQNLGMRLAAVSRTDISETIHATGVVRYNERDIAIVQARSGGYVERVARLAPGDVVKAGALIAELLVPQWAAAQQEYLALKAIGDAELTAAAEARMRLAGMPERLIREVKASGQVQDRSRDRRAHRRRAAVARRAARHDAVRRADAGAHQRHRQRVARRGGAAGAGGPGAHRAYRRGALRRVSRRDGAADGSSPSCRASTRQRARSPCASNCPTATAAFAPASAPRCRSRVRPRPRSPCRARR